MGDSPIPKQITLGSLRDRLNELIKAGTPADIPVFYATDEEGNSFEPILWPAGVANMSDDGFPMSGLDTKKPMVCIIN